jgi:hypothetical protein
VQKRFAAEAQHEAVARAVAEVAADPSKIHDVIARSRAGFRK